MPKYDLAGNPLPELSRSQDPVEVPGTVQTTVRYDLAGNPIPVAASPAPSASSNSSNGAAQFSYGATTTSSPSPHSGNASLAYSQPADDGTGKKKLWIGVGVGTFLVIMIAIFLLMPHHGVVPTAWNTFTASDKSFSCASPLGWDQTTGDKTQEMVGKDATTGGVQFQSGNDSINITTDTVATLVAYDVMHNNADPQSLTGSKAEVLHKQWKIATSALHKGYRETQITDFEEKMDDGRLAEWTANGNVFGFGGKVHGYRAALVGGGLTAVVVCQCSESDWVALKPAFQHVIASITTPEPLPGTAGNGMPAMMPMTP